MKPSTRGPAGAEVAGGHTSALLQKVLSGSQPQGRFLRCQPHGHPLLGTPSWAPPPGQPLLGTEHPRALKPSVPRGMLCWNGRHLPGGTKNNQENPDFLEKGEKPTGGRGSFLAQGPQLLASPGCPSCHRSHTRSASSVRVRPQRPRGSSNLCYHQASPKAATIALRWLT